MPKSGETRANANRRIRQEALREQLSQQKHVEHVIDISEKLIDLEEELDTLKIQRLKAGAELKLKLINKYLPDVRSVELSSDPDNPQQHVVMSADEYAEVRRKMMESDGC